MYDCRVIPMNTFKYSVDTTSTTEAYRGINENITDQFKRETNNKWDFRSTAKS